MKSWSRVELQSLVGNAVIDVLKEAGVVPKEDHLRRLTRVLLRGAARILIDYKVPVTIFVHMAVEAWNEEQKSTQPAPVPNMAHIDAATVN
jgi:hypothetical protein